MEDFCKKTLYAVGVVVMMASMWVSAEAKSLETQAARNYWPANDPELAYRLTHPPVTEIISLNDVE